jgi:hypothetical protein
MVDELQGELKLSLGDFHLLDSEVLERPNLLGIEENLTLAALSVAE